MEFGCAICISLNSENLICRSTDISKCFRGSLQLRDNESRLYTYFLLFSIVEVFGGDWFTTLLTLNKANSVYRGSYTSGHFIWIQWNEPSASFINFIWNSHECKILYIIWPFKMGFYHLQNGQYVKKKRIVDTDVVNDVTYSRQSVITREVIRFLWYDVI